jgi:hypothetical protein
LSKSISSLNLSISSFAAAAAASSAFSSAFFSSFTLDNSFIKSI